jgi:hypothetical protein
MLVLQGKAHVKLHPININCLIQMMENNPHKYLFSEDHSLLGMADERIPKKMLEMKLRGRRPRGRPRARWMDQVKRDMEKRGKKWTQVKQDRDWEDRDRWRFLCNS